MKKESSNHYDSTGLYYSVGNKGAYKRIGNEPVGQYINKTSKSQQRTIKINKHSKDIEMVCATHIKESIIDMQKVIYNISKVVSPIIDTVFNMQTEHGRVGLKMYQQVVVECGNPQCVLMIER